MASQVLSGSGNVTYTNNTGQNVRVVINFMSTVSSMSWAGVTHTSSISSSVAPTIGRNLAFNVGTGGNTGISANNMIVPSGGYETLEFSYPTEIMISAGQTFSAVLAGVYNIVVIPEAG
jgi:hypothetical protein